MKTLALLTILALPLLAQAAPRSTAIDGDFLVGQYFGPPSKRHAPLKGDDYLEKQAARGYVDGIKDLTEGERWCDPRNMPPHEIHSDVVQAISTLGAERRKTNAAVLVLETLVRLYPCKSTGAKS